MALQNIFYFKKEELKLQNIEKSFKTVIIAYDLMHIGPPICVWHNKIIAYKFTSLDIPLRGIFVCL
jgi:hypothetical protein